MFAYVFGKQKDTVFKLKFPFS